MLPSPRRCRLRLARAGARRSRVAAPARSCLLWTRCAAHAPLRRAAVVAAAGAREMTRGGTGSENHNHLPPPADAARASASDGAGAGDEQAGEAAAERECRICRLGEDDAGMGPLFHPCACSGSIRYVHQECLQRWLAHRRRTGSLATSAVPKCEVCSTPFRFSPVYKEGAPRSLPPLELVNGLMRRALRAAAELVRLVLVVATVRKHTFSQHGTTCFCALRCAVPLTSASTTAGV